MKAAVSREIGQIALEEIDDPRPRPGELGIELVATGVCHTDLTVLEGHMPSPRPIVLGHEGAGIVTAIGSGVDDFAIGDKVMKAIELGLATHVIDSRSGDLVEAVRDLTEGRGADYAFDAAGAPGTLESAIEAIRPGGFAVVIGRTGDIQLNIPTTQILRHKWVTGTFGGSIQPKRHIPEFVELYQQGRLELDRLMDAYYSLDEITNALDDLSHGRVTRGVIRF